LQKKAPEQRFLEEVDIEGVISKASLIWTIHGISICQKENRRVCARLSTLPGKHEIELLVQVLDHIVLARDV